MFALRDLPDVFADIDTGRTGSLAWGGALIRGVLFEYPSGDRRQVDYIFRTYPLAGTAAGAFYFVNHRQTLGTHANGIEGAHPGTGAESQAADGAYLHATAQKHRRPTIVHTVIDEFGVCLGNPVSAPRTCDIRLFGFDANT